MICTTYRLIGDLPFSGSTIQEIIRNNKECLITYDASDWSNITTEGKDITMRMLEKDPKTRITAKEALDHSWFTLEQTECSKLSMAQENIRKYCNGGRFNVEKIKPEFGLITIAPDSSDSPISSSSSPFWDSSNNIDLSQPFDYSKDCSKYQVKINIKYIDAKFRRRCINQY